MAKKIRNLESLVELYQLCLSRVSCLTCPMRIIGKNLCRIPDLHENPSYIPTAINLMRVQIEHDNIQAQYRRRLLFDDTK